MKDKAKEVAEILPVVVYRFCAYVSEKEYNSGNYFTTKDFIDFYEMKAFSSMHSFKYKKIYPEYCSMYWKIER